MLSFKFMQGSNSYEVYTNQYTSYSDKSICLWHSMAEYLDRSITQLLWREREILSKVFVNQYSHLVFV